MQPAGETESKVHEHDRNKPYMAHFGHPNAYRVGNFQDNDNDPRDREEIFESHENICRNNVERWTNKRPPEIDSVPPIPPEGFRESAKKISEAKMKLQNASPKAERDRIGQSFSPKKVE